MNIELNKQLRIDSYKEKSSDESIDALISYWDLVIPQDYIDFIKTMNEVEILVSGKRYIRIWGAEGCLELNEAYCIKQFLPGALAIGDDEGENALIYYDGQQGFGIYMVAFNDLEEDEVQYVSPSLSSLLIDGIGISKLMEL